MADLINRVRKDQIKDHDDHVTSRSLPELFKFEEADLFIRYLHEEMRCCYLLGIDHAAIVMACVLVERSLKLGILTELNRPGIQPLSSERINEVEEKPLADCANWAKSLGLLDKQGCKQIDKFRDLVRNVWLHGRTAEYVKETMVPMHVLNPKTQQIRAEVRRSGDSVLLMQLGQIRADTQHVEECVLLAHGLSAALEATHLARDSVCRLQHDPHYSEAAHRECLDRLKDIMKNMGFVVDDADS